ncbi:LPS-assembly protein LptD [Synechococcus sp. MIT S9509]|uniref:LPS export ABC transporter periplasmic protein LptC n=1 Tax=unclassified Synechococcus TaxID=2626047 RepID=UPI0007BB8F4F|nr:MULTISPECIES: LPS export ABC transporter periplasmic protein LptC [unclassified Synechococcus]KZR88035.1 LPS-assembly protein LptD [Synechococcus sp. MIT S9504]KZR92180.1 LPS-assembly protein LptD [Synechococcus sp. MIT S9509]
MTLTKAFGHLRGGLLITLLLLTGCVSEKPTSTFQSPPFVFRSLKLEQKTKQGLMDWSLNSPEARYELNRRLVRARQPVGVLYRKGKPSFRVQSDLALVVNDGEQILLEGDVRLQQLNGSNLLIQGDRLRWRPQQGILLIEQRPRATDKQSRISASEAQLLQTSNDLTLKGVVRLERWSEDSDPSKPDTTLRTGLAQWNLDSGLLNAEGPVLAQRRDQEGTVLEQLQGMSLQGNTQVGDLMVMAPVIVQMPRQKGILKAQDTTWNFRTQIVRSDQPFEAELDRTRIFGKAFQAELNDNTVLINGDCRIEQPGEALDATTCRWNWGTEEVLAEGNVLLKRDANDQLTRASKLAGQVGEKGRITFTAPGGKVESQVRFPSDQSEDESPRPRKSAPVEF